MSRDEFDAQIRETAGHLGRILREDEILAAMKTGLGVRRP